MIDSFFSLTTEDNFVSSFYLTKHRTFQISNRNKSNDKKSNGIGMLTILPILFEHVLIWNEMNIQNKDILIGNIHVTPGNKNQLKIPDKELERHYITRKLQ